MLITFFHFFFFNDTATTEIYTLSLHDALPIYLPPGAGGRNARHEADCSMPGLSSEQRLLTDRRVSDRRDRKSTRLNSSHGYISYAVFCLKKKKDIKWNKTQYIAQMDTDNTHTS